MAGPGLYLIGLIKIVGKPAQKLVPLPEPVANISCTPGVH